VCGAGGHSGGGVWGCIVCVSWALFLYRLAHIEGKKKHISQYLKLSCALEEKKGVNFDVYLQQLSDEEMPSTFFSKQVKRIDTKQVHHLPKLKKSCDNAGTDIKINLWLDNKISFPYRLAYIEGKRKGNKLLTRVKET
jgi:hypothetical protein